MKKIFLLALMAVSLHAHAQTEKGNLMVGANVGNASAFIDPYTETLFTMSVQPKLGYFIADKIAIGTGVQLGIRAYKHSTSFDYGLLPFGRYYFSSKRTSFFAEADLGAMGRTRWYSERLSSDFFYTAAAGPGVTYFITPSVGLEGLLKVRYVNEFDGCNCGSEILPELNFGFQIYLNRNKHGGKPEVTQP